MNAIQIFTESGYNMENYSNRKRVIQQLNQAIKVGLTIQLAPIGKVYTIEGKNYNVKVSGFGRMMRVKLHLGFEPIDVLKVCADFLQVKIVKEQVYSSISTPHECYKCEGKGVIPAFYYYAKGVCFDCGGCGFQGSLNVNVKKPKVVEPIDVAAITDIEKLWRILCVNDREFMVDGVRQQAFEQAKSLGHLTECTDEEGVYYQFNGKLRLNDMWKLDSINVRFKGCV